MTDTNTKDVETQKSNGDSASICSGVKTPLVDALRLYFQRVYEDFGGTLPDYRMELEKPFRG